MDVEHKNDTQKKGKIGIWLTKDEYRMIQNALMTSVDDLQSEREMVSKLSADLREVSLLFDNQQEDVELGASIVKSNEEIEGVFMSDGKVKHIDYFNEGEDNG
jgi:hypothetical protein